MSAVRIIGLSGIPLVKAGDDLASIILNAVEVSDVEVEDGDVFVVAQKIVSKAEGRLVELEDVQVSSEAMKIAEASGRDQRLVELVLRESKRILHVSQQTLIVEDKRGLVNINAGIDKSNVEGRNRYVLLPADPDRSARELRSRIMRSTGQNIAVIISDTYSRPFRRGQVNFAIGLAGFAPFFDYRGQEDLFGYVMQVKFTAVADELACAAELVMGQGKEATPVVLVKGFSRLVLDDGSSSKDLLIDRNEDLFQDVR
ncbi:MAG: coenzyme F420-0:L-glutamate ligase [Candidatus Bathyarchaeota archaeon]|nr:MAG: coenzyme F420-0:L-glutamate ligase [Candidatus Bathyarchaeota archaeon]